MFVAVGGHSRNVGKTSVVAGIIRALPGLDWTAIKITQFGHGICSASGEPCGCSLTPECSYVIAEEIEPGRSDTGRFVAAGARRTLWLRTAMGHLAQALPALRDIRAASRNLIVESNSIVELMPPDLYVVVLDAAQSDFKDSSRRLLARADACVMIERNGIQPGWDSVPSADWESKPRFVVRPPEYVPAELALFVERAGTVVPG